VNRLPHVTISGELGSGKSSVARQLAQLYSMRFVSTGDIQRSMAKSLNLSTLETNWLAERDDMIDSQVDQVTKDLGATSDEAIVFDSRMAWRMVPAALKVHLIVDPAVAAVRLHSTRTSATEQYESATHARDLAEERYQSERRRFLSTYGVDVFRLRNYDLVVDTSTAPVEVVTDTVRRLIDAVVDGTDTAGGPRVFVQPRRILPDSADWATGPSTGGVPQVGYARPTFVSIGGHGGVLQAIEQDQPLVEVDLVAEGAEAVRDGGPTAEQYVGQLGVAAWTERWHEEYGLVGPSVGG
jgi:predicted cytidylate kinase